MLRFMLSKTIWEHLWNCHLNNYLRREHLWNCVVDNCFNFLKAFHKIYGAIHYCFKAFHKMYSVICYLFLISYWFTVFEKQSIWNIYHLNIKYLSKIFGKKTVKTLIWWCSISEVVNITQKMSKYGVFSGPYFPVSSPKMTK